MNGLSQRRKGGYESYQKQRLRNVVLTFYCEREKIVFCLVFSPTHYALFERNVGLLTGNDPEPEFPK